MYISLIFDRSPIIVKIVHKHIWCLIIENTGNNIDLLNFIIDLLNFIIIIIIYHGITRLKMFWSKMSQNTSYCLILYKAQRHTHAFIMFISMMMGERRLPLVHVEYCLHRKTTFYKMQNQSLIFLTNNHSYLTCTKSNFLFKQGTQTIIFQ